MKSHINYKYKIWSQENLLSETVFLCLLLEGGDARREAGHRGGGLVLKITEAGDRGGAWF